MNKNSFVTFAFCLVTFYLIGQPDRWQQRVNYTMDIQMDAKKHQLTGVQKLVYTNNSPDTLTKVFYHLYFNAFQPNSMMDVRSRSISDPDSRVGERISKLKSDEIGYQKIEKLNQNGRPVKFEINESILEVTLNEPILPHSTTTFDLDFAAQVPIQIRRNGRDSKDGVAYSMSQWYPKLCEYDYQGWHSNPYVGREFYGVWGDFDVSITIDEDYVVAAGGYLQNPEEIGYGYEADGQKVKRPKGKNLTYHFLSPNVHDFVWAADKDYKHTKIVAEDGTLMHFFYKNEKNIRENWEKLPKIMSRARTFMNQRCGQYPYKEYYFIQGGDGGMEYPMATLISAGKNLDGLVGTAVHEQLHSWYQMVLGTNESLYCWMDEGFTSWAESWVMNEMAREKLMPDAKYTTLWYLPAIKGYKNLANSGKEEAMTTHADHFATNYAYSRAAYVKGDAFLVQLGYIIGEENLAKGMLKYFNEWKFKHPNDNDFVRIMEKQSGLELDWYKEYMVNMTATIDYAIDTIEGADKKSTRVRIKKMGRMPMPLDIEVTYKNGDKEIFYAPLESMRGEKPKENSTERTLLPDHRWVDNSFEFIIPEKAKKVIKVEIDPTLRMADINRENNVWQKE
jgi:Peptidase family M1 domain